MKIGILHLTDIHLTENKNIVLERIEKINTAYLAYSPEIYRLFIVISGDIANTGNEREYIIATDFLQKLKENAKIKAKFLNSIKYVVVPGNHDCDFSDNQDVRNALLQSHIGKDIISSSIVKQCLNVQSNFWSFYKENVDDNYSNKLYYEIKFDLTVQDSILFKCYNSGWCSKINESPGSLIFPNINQTPDSPECEIVVSVFHHPFNWYSPNTPNNNKKEFENHIEKYSNIIFCGHEHEDNKYKKKDFLGNTCHYFEGCSLQNSEDENTGFNYLIIDLNNHKSEFYNFKWNKDKYVLTNEKSQNFTLDRKERNLKSKPEYTDELINLKIPIKHSKIEDLNLLNIFVYPDLDVLSKKSEKAIKYVSSEILINHKLSYIEGEDQSGKSSLLSKIYIDLLYNNNFPLLIQGKEIKSRCPIKLITQNLKKQYANEGNIFDEYCNIPKNKKAILIDNFQDSKLRSEIKKSVIDYFENNFEIVIVINSSQKANNTLTEIKNIFKQFNQYKILPFGYLKRNELIEKWLELGSTENTLENEILQKVKFTFDKISNLLGEDLLPPYPIFLLTLLQSLDSNLSYDVAPTSYAYCYHSLIHLSLYRQGVSNEEIGSLFNFLTEFSFKLYEDKTNIISIKEFEKYCQFYRSKYIFSYSPEKLISLLKVSRLIKEEEDFIEFSYKYLYYYLVAKKIASFISKEKGKKIVNHLCANLNIEKNANILIFLSHHTDDNDLLEEILFSSLLPFEDHKPITLNRNDPFFKSLSNYVSEITNDILLPESDAKENREKGLEMKDKKSNTDSKFNINDEVKQNKNLSEYQQTFRIIKILGQIIKNQKGNFEKSKLVDLTEAAYNACFRSIDYYSTILLSNSDQIIDTIFDEDDNISLLDRAELKRKIKDFLFYMSFQICVNSFTNLSHAVGVSKMQDVYDDVSDRLDTPVSKLISFGIKIYYKPLSFPELSNLVKEFRDNPIIMHLLKVRVYNHCYNNNIDYRKRQRIEDLLNIKRLPKQTPNR